jgi:hypothetical protein
LDDIGIVKGAAVCAETFGQSQPIYPVAARMVYRFAVTNGLAVMCIFPRIATRLRPSKA